MTGRDKRLHYYREALAAQGLRHAEFDAEAVELVLDLAHTYDLLFRHLSRGLAEGGLSLSAFNLLSILSLQETRSCALHELGELMLVSRANVTGLVDSLVRRGLVERLADSADRRVRHARITSSGEALLEVLLPAHLLRVGSVCQGLDTSERQATRSLLGRLRAEVDPPPGLVASGKPGSGLPPGKR